MVCSRGVRERKRTQLCKKKKNQKRANPYVPKVCSAKCL